MLKLQKIVGFIILKKRWYNNQYRDVAISRLRPRTHFWVYGFQEGRLPSPTLTMLRGALLLNISHPVKLQFYSIYRRKPTYNYLNEFKIYYHPKKF